VVGAKQYWNSRYFVQMFATVGEKPFPPTHIQIRQKKNDKSHSIQISFNPLFWPNTAAYVGNDEFFPS
jgi:hypothetical protein